MRPETEKLKAHIDAFGTNSSIDASHVTRDEVKLQFYNRCVENQRKYSLVEFSRAEKTFRRKYSWCLEKRGTLKRKSLPVIFVKSGKRDFRKESLSKPFAFPHSFQERNTTSPSDSDMYRCSPVCLPDSRTQSRASTSQSLRDDGQIPTPSPYAKICSSGQGSQHRESGTATSQSREPSYASTGVSSPATARFPPNSMEQPSTRGRSRIDPYSNERLSQLEDMWDRVFRSDMDEDTHVGQKTKRRDQKSRDAFSGVLTQQFRHIAERKCQNEARRPSNGKRGSLDLPWHSTPRMLLPRASTSHESTLSPESGNVDDENGKNERKLNSLKVLNDKHVNKLLEGIDKEIPDDAVEDLEDKGGGKETHGNNGGRRDDNDERIQMYPKTKPILTETESHSVLESPSEESEEHREPATVKFTRRGSRLDGGRYRNRKLYSNWIKAVWKMCFLGILAVMVGSPNVYEYAKLAVQREKTALLKGQLWQLDMKRCYYLRIPESSAESSVSSQHED